MKRMESNNDTTRGGQLDATTRRWQDLARGVPTQHVEGEEEEVEGVRKGAHVR
jgi:hypothetical protein